MFKKILVALDGSEHADHALNVAIDLADKYSATVLLLSVFHPSPSTISLDMDSSFEEAKIMEKYLEGLKTYHENVLADALHRVKLNTSKLMVSTKLEKGRPADKIIETAREGKFDIIVMGSRGRGGVTQLLLGSVSDRVADHALCPVLIVK